MTRTILVIEDEPTLRETLAEALEAEGFHVVSAGDGRAGLALFRAERPDLILLDLMLPELSGIEVCRIVRTESSVPIAMLTARDAELDKVLGLELGADDYVTKPFSLRELSARIRAIFRRGESFAPGQLPPTVKLGPVQVDVAGHRVLRDGHEVPMKPKVFDLLAFLLRHAGQVVSEQDSGQDSRTRDNRDQGSLASSCPGRGALATRAPSCSHERNERMPVIHPVWSRALLASVLALGALPLAAGGLALAASTDYVANCSVNLRTSTSTSATTVATIPSGSVVTASGTTTGGSWSATCVTSVSGSSWYAITAVNGKSASSLYGTSTVYAAIGLFHANVYLEGVDVSHWQGSVNWSLVAGAGKRFAVMKATQGQTLVDSMYATNHAAARAAGVRAAAYHFASPTTATNDAVLQADWFVKNAALLPGDLVPALDLEQTGGLGTTALQTWVSAWLGEVYVKLGIRPMIYTSPSFWSTSMGNTAMFANQGYTVLWVAHWFVTTPTVPASNWGGHGWTFWQYDDCGTVAGISGCVDLDRYNGLDLTAVTYGANFAVSTSPGTGSAKQGAGTTFAVGLNRTYFTLPISLTVSGLPPGATATLSPTSTTGSSASLGVSTSKSGTITPVGSYALTLTATGGGRTRATTVTLNVTDGLPPAVTAARTRLYGLATLGSTTTPVRTTWSASDPSGISSYLLERQDNAGVWTVQGLSSPTSTSLTQSLTLGTVYRFRNRATDGNGNTSAFVYGPSFKLLRTQETSAAVVYSGAWNNGYTTYASGGSLKYTTTKGASATFTFTGSALSWVAYRGPNRGSAWVYVDGVYKATISLYATTYASKQIVYALNWASNGTHAIRVVCAGTAGHSRIDVDAFIRMVLL